MGWVDEWWNAGGGGETSVYGHSRLCGSQATKQVSKMGSDPDGGDGGRAARRGACRGSAPASPSGPSSKTPWGGSTLHRPKRRLAGNRLLGAPPPSHPIEPIDHLIDPTQSCSGGVDGGMGVVGTKGCWRDLSQLPGWTLPPPPLSPGGSGGGGCPPPSDRLRSASPSPASRPPRRRSRCPPAPSARQGRGSARGGGVRRDCPQGWKRGEERGTEKNSDVDLQKKTRPIFRI